MRSNGLLDRITIPTPIRGDSPFDFTWRNTAIPILSATQPTAFRFIPARSFWNFCRRWRQAIRPSRPIRPTLRRSKNSLALIRRRWRLSKRPSQRHPVLRARPILALLPTASRTPRAQRGSADTELFLRPATSILTQRQPPQNRPTIVRRVAAADRQKSNRVSACCAIGRGRGRRQQRDHPLAGGSTVARTGDNYAHAACREQRRRTKANHL